MTRDRAELQAWYRNAMLVRIDELRALRGPLQAEEARSFDTARSIGQALRGSGATFGFPHLTAVSTLLETSANGDTLRCVEGLLQQLYRLTADDEDAPTHRAEWLLRAADLPLDDGVLADCSDLADAWERVVRASGLDASRLSDAVARYFDLERADLSTPERAALRLIPEALVLSGRVLPVAESATEIFVATSDPTALGMELELTRLTGRRPVFAIAPPAALDAAIDALVDRSAVDEAVVEALPRPPVLDPEPVLGPDGAAYAVLVVDDEPSARHLLGALLEKRGFPVFQAEDGVDALERLGSESSIRVVVADLNMPRMDGLELIWAIREDPKLSELPVIVVTGETDEVLETQLIEEGADDYIQKPIDARLFLARVEATIRRRAK